MDTLLHEMAQVADLRFDDNHGHAETWRTRARHAGCSEATKSDRPVVGRRSRTERVTTVPLCPSALRRRGA